MSRHNEFDRRGSVLATERHHAFLGAAKVKLQHIDIGPKGRLDMAKVMRLRRVFRVNGIYPLQRENHVEVVISQSDLEQTLGQHGLTLQEFRGTDPGSYPTLDFTGRPLKCLHGKHRIQAARDVLPSFRRWWIVDFYIEGLSNELRNIQSETYAHENPKTKGEIYLKIRHYQRIHDPLSARRWEARLSAHEVHCIRMLEKHPRVQRAFDQFRFIPALMHSGALLSVWNKILACNCDNELIHYMRRGIWDFWATTVAQNENTKMDLIDANSVKLLEGLAPGISEADRTTVTGLVLSGKALEDFSPDERKAICERMRSYKGRIPSLSLFFQDVLILELGAARVKRLVDRSKRWGPRDIEMGDYQERKQTLRERMEHMFRCRDTDSIMVQTSDGEEREVTGDGEFQFDLAYRQLWLCALRSCSGSPGEGHRPATVCRSWTHPHEQYKLAQLASALGFRSNSISRLASRPFEPEYPPWYEFDDRGRNPALKRCGIPYTITFREDRKTLFLDRIHQEASEYEELDSAFVLRDIYLSFFGDLPSSVLEGPQRPRRARDGQSPEAGPLPTSGAENRPSSGAAPSSTTMPSPTTTRRPTSQRETGHPATPATPATPAADMNPQVNSGREQSAPSPSTHSGDIEEPSTRPTMPSETTGATTMPPTEPPVAHGETRDWSPELIALMNNLRKLRDDIDNLSIRLDNPKFTDQQSAIIELRKLDTATVESTDEETRQKLGTIYAEVNKRCMDIQSAKSHIHVVKVEVGSEISKLTAFTQNGEGKSQETTQVAQALRSAQAVFDSSQGKYEELDRFLRDVTPRIRPLQQQIAGIKVYLLGKCLIDLHHQYENCSSDIDTIKQSVADLNTKLDPQGPASHETDVTILNDIKDNAITKVNVIWRELDAVRGAFQEAGGKPRSLNPLDCESLQQNSATKLETLKTEAEKALTISRKQIQDVKQRLQTEYARIVLLAKEAVKSELDSESTTLKNMKSDYEGVHSSVERIRSSLENNQDSLKQNIEHSMLQGLSDLIDNGTLDGISRSLQTMQKTHDINVGQLDNSAISLEVPLDTQAKICDKYVGICTEITNRKKEREILRESTQEYCVQMAKTLQLAVSSQLEKVQLKASETTTQLQVVRDAESLTTAKQAMESAKQAANESMRLAKGMGALAGLVNQDGPLDVRKHFERGANDARTAAQEAESAAKAGQLFVNVWEEVVQKMKPFLQSANKWKVQSTQLSERFMSTWKPTQPSRVAKDDLRAMSALADKSCTLRNRVRSEIPSLLDKVPNSDQQRLVNLCIPEVEEATQETLTAAFGLFYCIAQKTGDHTKTKMMAFKEFSTLAVESIERIDKVGWLTVVRDARKAMKYLARDVDLAERGMKAADRLKTAIDLEGSKGALPGLALQQVEKTREYLQFAKGNQATADQMLQEIEISWERNRACRKQKEAQAEFGRARDAVNEIQPHHTFNEAEVVRNFFEKTETLFENTMKEFDKCRGPAERFEKIADTFANVSTRATSVIKGAEAVLRGIESGQFNRAQETLSDAEVTNLQTKRATPIQQPEGDQSTLQNKPTEEGSRVGEPSRRTTRTQSKHIFVFIIKTFKRMPSEDDWDDESHVIEKGKAFEKGQELCRRGTLYSLDVETWRLGSVTASVFEDAIAAGRKYFFLATEGELDDVSFDDVLVKAIECYKNHHGV